MLELISAMAQLVPGVPSLALGPGSPSRGDEAVWSSTPSFRRGVPKPRAMDGSLLTPAEVRR